MSGIRNENASIRPRPLSSSQRRSKPAEKAKKLYFPLGFLYRSLVCLLAFVGSIRIIRLSGTSNVLNRFCKSISQAQSRRDREKAVPRESRQSKKGRRASESEKRERNNLRFQLARFGGPGKRPFGCVYGTKISYTLIVKAAIWIRFGSETFCALLRSLPGFGGALTYLICFR